MSWGYSLPLEVAIRRMAMNSPSDAMAFVSSEIERQLRLMLASTGQLQRYRGGNPVDALNILAESVGESAIPQSLRGTIRSLYNLREDVTHGGEPGQPLVLSAVEYGLQISEMLRAIPRRSYVVLHNAVPIFSDPEGKDQRIDVHGVMLWTVGPNGTIEGSRLFPTRKHYFAGKTVSWEWDMRGPGWGESWYRDPMTEALTYAFSSSLEFIGQPLDKI